MTTPTATTNLYRCTCGRTVRADAPSNANDHCPFCGTRPSPDLGVTIGFDTGHTWYGDESSDFRCYDCDGRSHSHRRYPGDYDYTFILARADGRWASR